MVKIEVDYVELYKKGCELSKFVENTRKKVKKADSHVKNMSANWQGQDYNAFNKSWSESTDDNSSNHWKMIKQVEDYANFLIESAKKYADAQIRANQRI